MIQELLARSNVGNDLPSQRLFRHLHPGDELLDPADLLRAQYDALQTAGETRVEISHVVNQIGTREGSHEQTERVLRAGLRVHQLAVRGASGTEDRKPVAARQLGHNQIVQSPFGRAIGEKHRAHVQLAHARAEDEGCAGSLSLMHHQPGQRLSGR